MTGSMEAVVLALVALSPWAFGAVEPEAEFVLFAGVAVLLALWGARMLLEWRLRWAKCPVVLCLAGFLELVWLPAKQEQVDRSTFDQYAWAVRRHLCPLAVWPTAARVAVAALAMALVTWALRPLGLVAGLPAGALTYLATIRLLQTLGAPERAILARVPLAGRYARWL